MSLLVFLMANIVNYFQILDVFFFFFCSKECHEELLFEKKKFVSLADTRFSSSTKYLKNLKKHFIVVEYIDEFQKYEFELFNYKTKKLWGWKCLVNTQQYISTARAKYIFVQKSDVFCVPELTPRW